MTSRSFGHYIFIDESGGIAQRDARHVVICAVVTTEWQRLEQIVRFVRRRKALFLGKKSLLHATIDNPLVVEFLLNQVAQTENVWFVASVLDKRYYFDRNVLVNQLYQQLTAFTLRHTFGVLPIHPGDAYVVLERSFTKLSLNQTLREYVAGWVDMPDSQVQVAQKDDTKWGPGLQVADYASWSLFQKYERQDDRFASIIQSQFAGEERVGFIEGDIRLVDSLWK